MPWDVGVTDWDPEVDLEPDQSPDAVQELAFVLDQVIVADWPSVIDVGEAKRETEVVGGGVVETVRFT